MHARRMHKVYCCTINLIPGLLPGHQPFLIFAFSIVLHLNIPFTNALYLYLLLHPSFIFTRLFLAMLSDIEPMIQCSSSLFDL